MWTFTKHSARMRIPMADPLYLSLWFPNFEVEDMLPNALGVLRYFPFSAQRPGITYLAVHPVSWSEPTILEQRFNPGISAEEAILLASDLLHEDFAYTFEAFWDLWLPSEDGQQWALQPSLAMIVVHGLEFDNEAYQQAGHIEVDFGLDTPFVQAEIALTESAESSVRSNVKKLVDFGNAIEKHSGASARLLWSESEESLAQKLIARLQKVQ
jgi:hypothetical protein